MVCACPLYVDEVNLHSEKAKGKTSMHRKVSYHVVIVFTVIAKGKASMHRKISYPVVLV